MVKLPRFLAWRVERATQNGAEWLASLLERRILGRHLDSFDVLIAAQANAALDSARYYQDHMITALNFPNDLALLGHALQAAPNRGLALEFGVASGRTLEHIAKGMPARTVWGFDVFSGLPESWRTGFAQGAFARQAPPAVPANAKLVQGLFEETLPKFLASQPDESVAFLHVDCDLYSSTKTVLRELAPRLCADCIIVFDEYFNYPGWRHHEFKAWQEFVAEHRIRYEYLGFVSRHQQVAVRIQSIDTQPND